MTLLHIIAGLLGLAAGAVALYAMKGAKLHRKSGMIFVYGMLVMSASGGGMAALQHKVLDVIVAVLTFYLVTTALLTVRRPAPQLRWMDACAMLVALTLGLLGIKFGFDALGSPTGKTAGYPAAPYFIFGAVALLAALLDVRMLAGGVQGAHRVARHLWRMCFALWIAAASFFLGQPQVFPEPLRNFGLLAIPPLLVLLAMLYWLVRVLFTRRNPQIARLFKSNRLHGSA